MSIYVESPDALDATVNFTGTNWRVRNFQVAGDDHITRLVDLDNGAGREIEYLNLGYNSVVNLTSTKFRYMSGWDGDLHDITLGPENAWAHWMNLGALVNKVDTAVGWIGGMDIYRGRGEITVRGGFGTMDMGELDDKIVVDGGEVFSASMQAGNDTTILRNGGRIELLNDFGGNATVTVNDGSRIVNFRGGDGDVKMTLNGSGRVETAAVFNSDFTFKSADGWTRTISGHNVASDIIVGAGGAGAIKFTADTQQAHKMVLNGYVGTIDTTDNPTNGLDDQRANVTVNGGAGGLYLGNGNDVVQTGAVFVGVIATTGGNDIVRVGTGGSELVSTAGGNDKVFTKAGGVSTIGTGEGTDKVYLGVGGADIVRTGEGNDLIVVREMAGTNIVSIHGGSGVDTLSFKPFKSAVTFSLDVFGQYQNVSGAAPTDLTPAKGWFAEGGIENLIGGVKNDHLTGDSNANRLQGGKGSDTLEGGGGDDTLFGQLGADIFVFGANSGTDTVKDYVDNVDKLRIADHSGGFKSLDISISAGDKVIIHDGGTIILDGKEGVTLTASDFDFV
ncbi:MAG: calcium-binding protein [Pseudooceanicola sp.]|nr:calcium-binding protein [Pseudooceanicola sp.]